MCYLLKNIYQNYLLSYIFTIHLPRFFSVELFPPTSLLPRPYVDTFFFKWVVRFVALVVL